MNRKRTSFFLGFVSFLITAFPIAGLMAADPTWTFFESKTGVYRVLMPKQFEVKTETLTIADRRAVNFENAAGVIDQRPIKNATKSYIVKFSQTFGPPLKANDAAKILQREFLKYEKFYENKSGVIQKKTDNGSQGQWGGELVIAYQDPTFGQQAIRSRIFINQTTLLEQVIVGAPDIIEAYQARDFMDSLKIASGLSVTKETIAEKWKYMESPSGMFGFFYPAEKSPPYFTEDPVIKTEGKNENIGLSFYDPVLNEKVFINFYGMQFGANLNYQNVIEVLSKTNVARTRGTAAGLEFLPGASDKVDDPNKFPYVDVTYAIKPPPGFPYLQAVKIRSYFSKNKVFTMEVVGSDSLISSELVHTVLDKVIFQPDNVETPVPATTAPPAMPAEKTELKSLLPTAAPPASPATP